MNNNKQYTRKINPILGLLGFLGFFGFFGIFTYTTTGDYFPFAFFGFFGFFGFFFEGKRSNTLMDERYQLNILKAKAKAYQIGCSLTFACLILCCSGIFKMSVETAFLFLIISLSLIYGLTIFLYQYLLYHYDSEE